ncbi:LysR family transcriptional regulator [Trinickia diaoshuihuensis]|jgi:DNA-binding transcriptional LysR family regulator|uniref:LysR family transcriptional regulator n=1 Tax=Trinickia diaoshuihuensis TaxID=2292265 RepID=UPI001F07B601|nr:LysR family transcriptional regulator [Trinickia diaoshuihuensis]
MMDRLTSMAVFVKAVDLGSFAAAADALDLSGPMVGKHVRFLETRLGVQLLTRTTRRQSLTEFGRAFYERCRLVLAEADAAEALAADQRSDARGKLRVTMPVHFGRRCVAPILLDLVRQHPSLELDLSFNDRFVDLAEGDYDLAIRTGDLDDKAGVVARRIARQRMVVCAAPSYLEAHGRLSRVEELAEHDGLVYRRSGRIRPWLFPRDDGTVDELIPLNRVRLDDLDAIADAAASGLGLAWLPSWLVRDRIAAGTLVRLVPERRPFLYDAYALWMQTPHLPFRVRLAVDTLVARLADLMD